MAKLEIERRFLLKKLPNNLGEGKLTEQVYLSLINLKIKDDFLYYEDKKNFSFNKFERIAEDN